MATCEERHETYEAKCFGSVTWEVFTEMNEKQMVDVMEHLSEAQRECFMAAVAKQEEERKVRWVAKKKAEEELLDLVETKELTQETLTKYMEETEADLNSQDKYGWTILMRAGATREFIEGIRMLIEANVNVDVQDCIGQTALHFATVNGHSNSVALLIDAKADLEIRDHNNSTALCYSMRYSTNPSIAVQLMRTNANPWAHDNSGSSPMSLALQWQIDHKEIMNWVLQQSPSEHGVTALMVAASHGHEDTIPKLLEMGENPELEDKNGMTALMMAMMPREGESNWQIGCKRRIVNLLRGDRTNAELNEMCSVLYFPKVPPPLYLLWKQT